MEDSIDQENFQFINIAKLLADKYKCTISKIDLENKIIDVSGEVENKKLFLNALGKQMNKH